MSDYILRLKNISKYFGGVKALKGVQLDLKDGEIHALVGENGAGKSTLMKVLSGVYQPTGGTIEFQGKPITFDSPQQAREVGIGIIYQEFSLIPDLTVYENIFLGRELKKKNRFLNTKEMIRITQEKLKDLGVEIDPQEKIRNLSIAKQQFCEIVKAVSDNLKVLILDEPTATLTPGEVKQLFALMRRLLERGVSMIFISHHLDDIFTIADEVTVFRDGEYIGSSPVAQIERNELVRMMVGRSVDQEFPAKRNYEALLDQKICLEASVQRLASVETQHFILRKSEILGISGLVGAGRTELFRSLVGANHALQRKVLKNGVEIKIKRPFDAVSQGIGYVSEDRKGLGLILPFSIQDNIVINSLDKNARAKIFVNERENAKISKNLSHEISIKTPSIKQLVQNLSGGNQQKVAIAKWLSTDCDVIIFDEPTRGVDVGAKAEIYNLIHKLAAENGLSIIMISSEMPEVVGLSDRVLVMRSDRIVAELEKNDINPETIMSYATGGLT